MPPLQVLEPKLPEFEKPQRPGKSGTSEPNSASDTRALNVITHFMKGDNERHLGLKIKLPDSVDDRSVKEAIVDPFVAQYDKKFTKYPASAFRPFLHIKVLVWSGPRPCAADVFRDKDRDGVEDIQEAEKPIYALLDVEQPVSVLRKRAHNKLRPTVEVELVAAESTAIVLRSFPTTTLLAPGEQLLTMLTDIDCEPDEMHALVDAAIAGGELAYLGLTSARDRDGRNALHLAVTRGDLTLCRKLLRRRQDVHAMDSNRDTALHVACLAGRQLIVADLVQLGAHIHEKNRDLMSPIQLSVVDEAHGNGEVVRMLVEAGCDIDAKCWDITPLMAAASAGHVWALEVLLELGADTMVRNGYEMMALDYARCQDTAELIHEWMRGFLLPDAEMLERQQASRNARKRNTTNPPAMSHETEHKGPRLYQATRVMSLEAAFEALELPTEWLAGFRASGEHFGAVRRKWRQIVLVHHPDRLPATLTAAAQQEHTAIFTRAMGAFEALDTFYARRHAPDTTPHLADEWAAAPTGEASATRSAKAREDVATRSGGGSSSTAAAAAAAATAASAATTTTAAAAATTTTIAATDAATDTATDAAAGGGSDSGDGTASAAPPPVSTERKFATKDKAPMEIEVTLEATTRAARPLLFKRRVRIVGLVAKPEHNGKLGRAKLFDRCANRYGVELEDGGGTLKVKEVNLELAEDAEGEAEVPALKPAYPPKLAQPMPISCDHSKLPERR